MAYECAHFINVYSISAVHGIHRNDILFVSSTVVSIRCRWQFCLLYVDQLCSVPLGRNTGRCHNKTAVWKASTMRPNNLHVTFYLNCIFVSARERSERQNSSAARCSWVKHWNWWECRLSVYGHAPNICIQWLFVFNLDSLNFSHISLIKKWLQHRHRVWFTCKTEYSRTIQRRSFSFWLLFFFVMKHTKRFEYRVNVPDWCFWCFFSNTSLFAV